MSNTVLFDANNLAMRILCSDDLNRLPINESQIQNFIQKFLSKFLFIIKDIQKNYAVDNILFVWDSTDNKRKKIYPDYKLRKFDSAENKSNCKKLICLLRANLQSLGLWIDIDQEGYEADDLIAYIIKHRFAENFIIVSSDSDFYQLLSQRVMIYNIDKKKYYTRVNFNQEFGGIIPENYAKMKALVGDKSDNIKGVFGIGFKKATKMIQEKRCWSYWVEKYHEVDLDLNLELIKLPFEESGINPLILNIQSFFNFNAFITLFQVYTLRDLNIHEFKKILCDNA